MRNKFFILLLFVFASATKLFADTTSVATDSVIKPFSTPNQGPLGIDNTTGLALYATAILLAVLVIALWRKNIIKKYD